MKFLQLTAAFLLFAGAAHAQDAVAPSGTAGHFQARLRGVVVVPDPKVFMGTHIRASGGAVQASARINPWLIGAGVGMRF